MLNAFQKEPWPRSHHDLIQHYYAQYDKAIAAGEYQPFLYPWGTLGAVVVIVYLLIPHQNRPWLKKCRYLAFAWITAFAIYTILFTRAKGMAAALGTGLISAWSVCWVSAILVCNDAQTDFSRIERLEGAFKRSPSLPHTSPPEDVQRHEATKLDMTQGHAGPSTRHGQFAWQAYPLTPFIERLDWVCDIFCNFRGAGWNWRTSALPPPPKHIQEQLYRNSGAVVPKSSNRVHTGQVKLYPTRRELLIQNAKTLVVGYLTLDLLKTLMMYDRYFWGIVSPSSQETHLPPPFTHLPAPHIWLHTYHLTLSMLAVKSALQTIFSLGPLFFSGLLGPSILGARAHPFMYPETWAPYTIVLDNGLAGWWGSWWHQTFRFAFAEPSRVLLEKLGWGKHEVRAKVVQLVIAFGMSGVVHACGSWTCAGVTRPVKGPIAFFLLQAIGILVESSIAQGLRPLRLKDRVPKKVVQVCRFVYVHFWFYHTAHLLCDDFARGGVWLFEPIPVSILRGLGFGADARDGWWCWGGLEEVVRWHRGETWWTSGIAF
ncbi:membrane bound O-acyl transferase family-domain-containing protein [Paraphoma chrysanthemicola]|uniref:Membrane bound O-acyl transferase family-domain-containing protein n=1 Tax=Paraphoma chrysanthemicola TaxID=798071 RepID=A0A8K0R8I7_9PLEO|nr:membrane bound O-acyl transferase family-domain-containing protein [Paraphoma chrysanthemicola]